MIRRVEVLLSMQRALWDMISPDMRGIAVSFDMNSIRARFIYDHVVDEEAEEIVSEVETYVLADFEPGLHTEFITEYLSIDKPRERSGDETWVYLRRES